jgi:hypothetical protein
MKPEEMGKNGRRDVEGKSPVKMPWERKKRQAGSLSHLAAKGTVPLLDRTLAGEKRPRTAALQDAAAPSDRPMHTGRLVMGCGFSFLGAMT